jgi:formylglycine-generating enzyme required for sulfatase activity
VSIYHARSFVRALSKQEGKRYRLPTEAEWELACKGTNNSIFSGTNTKSEASQFAVFSVTSSKKSPKSVASKTANSFGLYDLSGNVYEWVEQTVPYQVDSKKNVLKGGSWTSSAMATRCSHRAFIADGEIELDTSFRVAISLDEVTN